MIPETVVKTLEQKYHLLQPELDERGRRLWAAIEAMALGHGGVRAVAQATGLAESTIRLGRRQLQPVGERVVDPSPGGYAGPVVDVTG